MNGIQPLQIEFVLHTEREIKSQDYVERIASSLLNSRYVAGD